MDDIERLFWEFDDEPTTEPTTPELESSIDDEEHTLDSTSTNEEVKVAFWFGMTTHFRVELLLTYNCKC